MTNQGDTQKSEKIVSIHTSNIANVAYENCKILKQFDCDVELYCHDMTHIMSQPEWDDLDLDSSDFPDENDFYSNTADFGSYKRPDWYHSGTLFSLLMNSSEESTVTATPDSRQYSEGAEEVVPHCSESEPRTFPSDQKPLAITYGLKGLSLRFFLLLVRLILPLGRKLPASTRARSYVWYSKTYNYLATPPKAGYFTLLIRRLSRNILFFFDRVVWRLIPYLRMLPASLVVRLKRVYHRGFLFLFPQRKALLADNVEGVVARSKRHGEEWAISVDDCNAYDFHVRWLNVASSNADVIFSYVLSPIYALLNHTKPYIAVEIGTMRDIPFEGTSRGRLLAQSYREADYVLITNPDVLASAKRLKLKNFDFCPHPIDEDRYAPLSGRERAETRKQLFGVEGNTLVLFAPARQNWKVKGNDKYYRAIKKCIDQGVDLKLVIPGWGQEVERSKQYCKELGIEKYVKWIKPLSEGGLVKYFSATDIVLDQFELGVFGLITPKALSCGAVVITSYSESVNEWCFKQAPPLMAASRDDEIFEHIKKLYFDREYLRNKSVESRDWVIAEHSKERVKATLMSAAAKAKANFEKSQRKNEAA